MVEIDASKMYYDLYSIRQYFIKVTLIVICVTIVVVTITIIVAIVRSEELRSLLGVTMGVMGPPATLAASTSAKKKEYWKV